MNDLVKLPAPRFWCSETQAAKSIVEKLHGVTPKKEPLPQRKRMYDQLYSRFLEERELRPSAPMSEIVIDIVNSPAPESYITPESAKVIISVFRKEKREANKDFHSRAMRSADAILRIRAERDGTKPRPVDWCAMDKQDDVYVDACECDPSGDKHLRAADSDIPCQGKIVAIGSKCINSIDYTKFANRKHTNVRYLRTQLRISWDSDHGK